MEMLPVAIKKFIAKLEHILLTIQEFLSSDRIKLPRVFALIDIGHSRRSEAKQSLFNRIHPRLMTDLSIGIGEGFKTLGNTIGVGRQKPRNRRIGVPETVALKGHVEMLGRC